MQKILYSDISLFAQQVGNALVYNLDSLNQNLVLILLTPIRACWFQPQLGSMIPKYLFDPIDEVTALKIQREIKIILERNGELRINLVASSVTPLPDESAYKVRLVYEAPFLSAEQVEFEFSMGA